MPVARSFLFLLAALCSLFAFRSVYAETPAGDEQARALIARWYDELKKGEDGRPWNLFAPGAIIPAERARRINLTPGARSMKLVGPPFPHELIRRVEKFSYEIAQMRVEGGLAKVRVWERGWTYAWAAKKTYQSAAEARFVLERGDDGAWLIIAFDSNSSAIHPKHADDPLPDLSPEGKAKTATP